MCRSKFIKALDKLIYRRKLKMELIIASMTTVVVMCTGDTFCYISTKWVLGGAILYLTW